MTVAQPILVIAGPTASGKSRVALQLAGRLEGEIVSADSVQVYRGFDVGSAKPTRAERARMPHHLIDILDPTERMDAGAFARRADHAIAEIAARGRIPIVVGGTGLWLRALLRGLVELPPPDLEVRATLEREADRVRPRRLHERLSRIDPRAAAAIHPNDRVRIVRALEVFEQTGTPLGEHQARHALGAPRYPGLFVVVDRPREELDERIGARADAMLEAGFSAEVEQLLGHWPAEARAFGSVGYRQMVDHVTAQVPLEETREKVIQATRRYARRQRTWFASEPGFHWNALPAELLTPTGFGRVKAALRKPG